LTDHDFFALGSDGLQVFAENFTCSVVEAGDAAFYDSCPIARNLLSDFNELSPVTSAILRPPRCRILATPVAFRVLQVGSATVVGVRELTAELFQEWKITQITSVTCALG